MDEAIPEVVELAVDKIFEYVQVGSIPFVPAQTKDRLKGFCHGWHVTVATSAFIAFGVLVANLGLLIWGQLRHIGEVSDGVLTLFSGNCEHMQRIFTWSHVGINILSTMLLAASNTSCQVLSAPTRREIDVAHRAGHWLDVGVSSFRNLRFVAIKRLLIYILLALSSIPLHLIYNSILFPTTTAYNNLATYVSEDFIKGAPWNETIVATGSRLGDENVSILKSLQLKAFNNELERMDRSQCVSQLSRNYISKYRNFLIVVKDGPVKSSLSIFQGSEKQVFATQGLQWICKSLYESKIIKNSQHHEWICGQSLSAIAKNPSLWTIKSLPNKYGNELHVSYCLAEPAQQKCTLNMSRPLLIAVIICNFVKLLCFLFVVRWADGMPLVTMGDAIESFLRKPDPSTEDLGPITAAEVREGIWRGKSNIITMHWPFKAWPGKKRFWYSACGWKRWVVSGFILFSMYFPAASLPYWAWEGANRSWGNISKMGTIIEQDIVPSTAGWTITAEVVFVNLPQLILSLAYIFFNNILTSCLQASECADYARDRKGLRVTTHKNLQRSTYWLQVPYRYAFPLMAVWIVVHWLSSQSLFLARLNVLNYYNNPKPHLSSVVNGCGFSPIPILMVICFIGAMIVGMFGMGFRRYPGNIPLMSSCTVAIAAACHASEDEGEEMAALPLQYGVLENSTVGHETKFRKVGFSSREVESLVPGEVYR